MLVIQTPHGVFSNKNLLQSQYQEQCSRGSRLISSKTVECSESSPADGNEFDEISAARCRIYKRSNRKVVWSRTYCLLDRIIERTFNKNITLFLCLQTCVFFFAWFCLLSFSYIFSLSQVFLIFYEQKTGQESVFHRLMGPRHHSLSDIDCLSSHNEVISFLH